jgi:hypothetical protein
MRIFLCHSSGDKIAVRKLYHRLRADGFNPWLDEEDLIPGQDWDAGPRRLDSCSCLSPQASLVAAEAAAVGVEVAVATLALRQEPILSLSLAHQVR